MTKATLSWIQPKVEGLGPPARGGHASAAIGSRLIIFGGTDRSPTPYDDIWCLETEDGKYSWTRIAPTCSAGTHITPRSGATLTAVGNDLYLFGGQDPVSGTCFNDVFRLCSHSWSWQSLPVEGARPPGRHGHGAALLQSTHLVVHGGASDVHPTFGDLWLLDLQNRRWERLEAAGPQPCGREMHSLSLVSAKRLLVFGGRDGNGRVLDDAAVLDLESRKWTLRESAAEPRCCHTAVVLTRAVLGELDDPGWHGEDADDVVVLAFGGFSGTDVTSSLTAIQPKALRATAVDAGGELPASRFAHSAAVLGPGGPGAMMAVFGGVTPACDLDDVAILRPGP